VAQAFMAAVYRLHGMPESIVSDRDRIFTSTLWRELFRLSGTQLLMSSSYHPQTDGQTERVNQCLETFLRSFVQSCPSKWASWLSVAEFWYNTCFHSSLGSSPFEVLYGRSPRHFGLSVDDSVAHTDLNSWLNQRELMLRVVKNNLQRAQQRMRSQADKKRAERVFQVGDKVYLKLQPYVQSSVATRANHKLSYKFFGPYEVLQKVGAVAYKLRLPESSSVHPVFHVSQLKQYIKPNCTVSSTPPAAPTLCYPVQVMQRRTITRGSRQVAQVLIRWSGCDAALDTWEDELFLRRQFPSATAWGQAASKEGGNVNSKEDYRGEYQKDADKDTEQKKLKENVLGRRVSKPSGRYPSDMWSV
jgi:hypothetical protein